MNSKLVKAALAVVFALSLAGCVSLDSNGNGASHELPPIDFGPSNGE